MVSSVVVEVPEPWNLKTETPPPYGTGTAEDKVAVTAFASKPTTRHAFISAVEGLSPNVRISASNNLPYRIHGLIVDYDNPLPEDPVGYIRKHQPDCFEPCYLVRTTRAGRLVWAFESPVLFSTGPHMKEFVKLLVRNLKINKWLGGLDTEALTDWGKYYELGRQWIPIAPNAVIPTSHLSLWYFKASEGKTFDARKGVSYTIPIDVLEKAIHERYPGRWKGPLTYGARGIRFWDPSADNPTAAIILEEGVLAFTGKDHFLPWRTILGPAFVEQYEAAAISDIVSNTVYDGKTYYLKSGEDLWTPTSKEDFAMELRVRGKDSHKRPGQTASEQDIICNHIQRTRRIVAARPFLYFPKGLIFWEGRHFLNTSRTRPLPPAPPDEEGPLTFLSGRTKFPFIHKLMRNMFAESDDPEGARQLGHLFAWMKYAYTNALEYTPKPGQTIVLAGPPGKGKTLLSWEIISRLLGGRADGAAHLVNGDIWTERNIEQPVMTIDDSSALSSARALQAFTDRIKRYTANNEMLYNQKYEKSGGVPWIGRIVITCNLDPESLRILPDMDSSTQDKISLFKASAVIIDFEGRDAIARTLAVELPIFARFLLDWRYPEECIAEEKRFFVKSYHHPELFEEARQQGLGMIIEIIASFLETYFSVSPTAEYWQGTATQLYKELLELNPGLDHEIKCRGLPVLLGKLAKARYNVAKYYNRESELHMWRIGRTLTKAKRKDPP